jgi:ketosteroid isomerase-like protein
MRLRVAGSISLLLAACPAAPAKPDLDAEKAALMQTSRDWAATVPAGNIDSILSFWSDDAVLMPPDEPALVGKDAIRNYVTGALAIPGFMITWEPEQAMISASGDMAYLIERSSVSFSDSTGAKVTQLAKAVTVWRKDPRGRWRCVVDTWNNVPSHPVLAAH